MSTEHILKTVEPYFTAIATGEKTFEVRRNDRSFQKGDTVLLYDYDSERCTCSNPYCTMRRPPIRKTINFVFAGDPQFGPHLGGLVPGYVVLSLGDFISDAAAAGEPS